MGVPESLDQVELALCVVVVMDANENAVHRHTRVWARYGCFGSSPLFDVSRRIQLNIVRCNLLGGA